MAAASITLAEAVNAFRGQLGSCTDEGVLQEKVRQGIEWMMLNGGGQLWKEWEIPLLDWSFSLPRDLEAPVKYKLGRSANSGFGVFNTSALSFGSQGLTREAVGYYGWGDSSPDFKFASTTNRVFTQYPPPLNTRYRLIAITDDPVDVGKQVEVMGNINGLPNAPILYGQKTAGEVLPVFLRTDPDKKYSSYVYEGPLTGVLRDATCSYGQLWAQRCDNEQFCLLSYYYPDDERPVFAGVQLFGQGICSGQCIHILGRVNPALNYKRMDDILPITSPSILDFLAKRAKYDEVDQYENVVIMEGRIAVLIKRYLSYQGNTEQLSVNLKGSGFTYSNI